MHTEVFKCLKPNKDKYQMICFPYLGGYSHSLWDLANSLDSAFDFWAAVPPGHIGASSAFLIEDVKSLLEYYFNGLKNIVREGYTLFGHSMGGIIAYYLAGKIAKSTEFPKPKAIVLSASSPPSKFHHKKCSELPDEALINLIMSYGAMPMRLLRDQELMQYLLPTFRADYKVLESTVNCLCEPLDIPAYFLVGEKDSVNPLRETFAWRKYFSGQTKLFYINNGTHMFVHDKAQIVADRLKEINKIDMDFPVIKYA
jgi:external thioesterase TEII